MIARRTLLSLAGLALAGVAVAAALSGHRATADENSVLYISGLRVGKGNSGVVRLHNTTATEQINVRYSVFDPENKVRISPFRALTEGLFINAGDTFELDIGAIVRIGLAETGNNPNFKGQVSFIANGGFTPAFGPDKLHVEAIQTEGKATYPVVVRWRSQP